jgi:hypothetical protein
MQIDEPKSSCVGQCRGEIVDLHPIITSCGFYVCLINMDKFFGIAEPIILIDVPGLELIWPSDIPECGC